MFGIDWDGEGEEGLFGSFRLVLHYLYCLVLLYCLKGGFLR